MPHRGLPIPTSLLRFVPHDLFNEALKPSKSPLWPENNTEVSLRIPYKIAQDHTAIIETESRGHQSSLGRRIGSSGPYPAKHPVPEADVLRYAKENIHIRPHACTGRTFRVRMLLFGAQSIIMSLMSRGRGVIGEGPELSRYVDVGSGVDNALSAGGLQRYCKNIRTLLFIP
jgi:hypothetical protein